MIDITSRKNKLITETAALTDKRERDRTGLFFTEGTKLLSEALSVGILPERIFAVPDYIDAHDELCNIGSEIFRVTREVYDRLTDESAPEGVLAVFKKPELTPVGNASVLILEGIQDPGNMGTLIRCAVAFGVSRVLTVGCADIYGPKAVRSAMGGVFKMSCTSFADVDEAVECARSITDKVIAAALLPDSISIEDADTSHAAIMIGNEGKGLSARALELADMRVIIPIENIESLNASVAGAICMYDSMIKRKVKANGR